jgi:hypothetical protein
MRRNEKTIWLLLEICTVAAITKKNPQISKLIELTPGTVQTRECDNLCAHWLGFP